MLMKQVQGTYDLQMERRETGEPGEEVERLLPSPANKAWAQLEEQRFTCKASWVLNGVDMRQ